MLKQMIEYTQLAANSTQVLAILVAWRALISWRQERRHEIIMSFHSALHSLIDVIEIFRSEHVFTDAKNLNIICNDTITVSDAVALSADLRKDWDNARSQARRCVELKPSLYFMGESLDRTFNKIIALDKFVSEIINQIRASDFFERLNDGRSHKKINRSVDSDIDPGQANIAPNEVKAVDKSLSILFPRRRPMFKENVGLIEQGRETFQKIIDALQGDLNNLPRRGR